MWNGYWSMVNGAKLTTLVILILVDFVLGVIVAIKGGTFQFAKLAKFLNTSVLEMVGGYFIIGAIALVEPSYSWVVPTAWGLLDASLLAMVWAKLHNIWPALPTPKFIAGD